jgi:MerR family transcriptional regulator, light-induced transcriptional regulator
MPQNLGMPDEPRPAPADGAADPMDLDVGLGVAAVARRLGVAAGTLRTWDRRYGVGPTGHVAGSHRRYTAVDVARLTLMRRLMLEGVSSGEAARAAREVEVDALVPMRAPARTLRGTRRARAGGGRVVALREASPAARGLARAAMALDSGACTAAIVAGISRRGVVATWNDLLLPVLIGVGERWRATGAGVEVEHLLSECVEDALRAVSRRLSRPINARPVLLAALEAEEHRLALHALAAGLAEQSVAVRMLGARLPAAALVEAVGRTGPAVVFVWAQGAGEGRRPVALGTLPVLRSPAVLLLGGPGWAGSERPPHAEWVTDLASAVDAVVAAIGVDPGDPR